MFDNNIRSLLVFYLPLLVDRCENKRAFFLNLPNFQLPLCRTLEVRVFAHFDPVTTASVATYLSGFCFLQHVMQVVYINQPAWGEIAIRAILWVYRSMISAGVRSEKYHKLTTLTILKTGNERKSVRCMIVYPLDSAKWHHHRNVHSCFRSRSNYSVSSHTCQFQHPSVAHWKEYSYVLCGN